MKPNIFSVATKELSQDGFFTWLLQWADNENSKYDQQLNETAKDFVRLILDETTDYQINKVKVRRQWNNIDISAEINDEYFIVIEDKTNTREHSKQLERYQKEAEEQYKNHKNKYVYLKTGNESLLATGKVKEKGYKVIDRKAILNILNKREIHNEILNDFKDYLAAIENETNSFTKFDNLKSKWYAGEGFFIKLQENITKSTDWQYVANQTGGFIGFWYHSKEVNNIGYIYIQIENAIKKHEIKLVIKIDSWRPNITNKINTLHKLLNEIKPYAKENGITLIKPDKFRKGKTSTLAIVENAFTTDKDGNLEFQKFLETLKALEKTIYDYCENINTSDNKV
ncbi:MAG TPA: PD-(D/E)XK nuclease family protein [Soehngenia sp.]|jgi:hypothetical protein|nr:PD-(D/E)XK nuclease family protein [Soehngenia sp.]